MITTSQFRGALAAAAALAFGGCTSGQVGQYPVSSVNVVTASKLQFGVGWATSYPYSPAGPELNDVGYSINLVETFRQSNGRSAVLSDTAEIDLPGTLGAPLAGLGLGNDLQFGSTLQAFGAGFNSGSFTTSGTFNPYLGTGGPPAFPPPADSTSVTEQSPEGYYAAFAQTSPIVGSAFAPGLAQALATFPGQYTLNVTVPTGLGTTDVVSTRATLAGNPLPPISPPAVSADGNGGALLTVTIPAGVTETMVTVVGTACQVQTSGSASPSPVVTRPEVYTLVSHVAGPGSASLSLPDYVTPVGGLGQYQSLCPAAEFPAPTSGYAAYAIGFDYPAFESVYPQSFSQTPAIVGPAGQPDITISSPANFFTP